MEVIRQLGHDAVDIGHPILELDRARHGHNANQLYANEGVSNRSWWLNTDRMERALLHNWNPLPAGIAPKKCFTKERPDVRGGPYTQPPSSLPHPLLPYNSTLPATYSPSPPSSPICVNISPHSESQLIIDKFRVQTHTHTHTHTQKQAAIVRNPRN